MERTLTVKGTGRVSAAPDQIELSFGLEIVRSGYEQAMAESARLLEALQSAVETAGFCAADLKTQSFGVDTKYETWRDKLDIRRERFKGYVCAHRLRLEFPLDMRRLGLVVGALSEGAGSPAFKIAFKIADPSAVSAQLLENAVRDAAEKAGVLAAAAGVTLGPIQKIDYSWSAVSFYSKTNMDCEAGAVLGESRQVTSAAIDISPDAVDARDTATVVWAIA